MSRNNHASYACEQAVLPVGLLPSFAAQSQSSQQSTNAEHGSSNAAQGVLAQASRSWSRVLLGACRNGLGRAGSDRVRGPDGVRAARDDVPGKWDCSGVVAVGNVGGFND